MKSFAFFSWTVLYLLSTTGSLAGKSGKNAQRGDNGRRLTQKPVLPFCQLDYQAAKYIKKLSEVVKGRSNPFLKSSKVKSACEFPFPTDCGMAAFTFPSSKLNTLTVHYPLANCCMTCHHPHFTRCFHTTKSCERCILNGVRCMTNCITRHSCSASDEKRLPSKTGDLGEKGHPGRPGQAGRPGKAGARDGKGARDAKSPTKKQNACPTRKVKNGKSYCIERSCIPVV